MPGLRHAHTLQQLDDRNISYLLRDVSICDVLVVVLVLYSLVRDFVFFGCC